ncbi:MAG: type II secretion system protein [Lachnospiraceae bacterium]
MKKFLKKDKKGFTLAELLIVVAIIAVLVAISIPIFNAKLETSREAVDVANLRAAYALGQADVLTDPPSTTQTKYYDISGTWASDKASASTGKGTDKTTTNTYDLPEKVTYDSSADCTVMVIEVVYSSSGVTSCKFVAK